MNVGKQIVVGGLQVYRWIISPAKNMLTGTHGSCRFSPTCSAYAMEAVTRHGVLAGGTLAVKRLCRCHPWGGAGMDPVPDLGRISS